MEYSFYTYNVIGKSTATLNSLSLFSGQQLPMRFRKNVRALKINHHDALGVWVEQHVLHSGICVHHAFLMNRLHSLYGGVLQRQVIAYLAAGQRSKMHARPRHEDQVDDIDPDGVKVHSVYTAQVDGAKKNRHMNTLEWFESLINPLFIFLKGYIYDSCSFPDESVSVRSKGYLEQNASSPLDVQRRDAIIKRFS